MGNEPLEVNAKGRKVNRRRNTKGRKVNRRRNTKGQISATKMGLSATKWAYRRQNGLIGNVFCFGLGLELSRTVISVGCWSRREW